MRPARYPAGPWPRRRASRSPANRAGWRCCPYRRGPRARRSRPGAAPRAPARRPGSPAWPAPPARRRRAPPVAGAGGIHGPPEESSSPEERVEIARIPVVLLLIEDPARTGPCGAGLEAPCRDPTVE
ncbi:hypothetical protein AWN76_016450 [Rhodothermaceae bacterium RA]|nr:hypothetical protein AWN76_016450 [Rhodothermaceae bacterium RA]